MPTLLIHKYDKTNPNYVKDWTSISDIGKTFYEEPLTLNTYLETEDRYVQVILNIMGLFHIQKLEVRTIEKYHSLQYVKQNGLLNEKQAFLYQKIDNGVQLNYRELSETIRLNLRESIWCGLYSPEIEVNFGYDYYEAITIANSEKLELCKQIIEDHGLYWQEISTSPFKIEEEFRDALTYTWGDGQTNPPGDYHHDLRISKDDPLNRTYTEWSHFDEIENGLDRAEYQTVEQKYLHLVLDFLDKFQVSEFAINGLHLNNIQGFGISEQYFSPQEKALFQQMYKYEVTIEDWTIKPFIVRKEDFSTLFKLMFKRIFTNWITDDSITIQFDASFRLYLSFYGHKKEVQELVEKHGLYWQERQPPYHEAVYFT
ncbi:hypothetical protein [Streptococcus sp. NLN64]|uniref:hypothetical protein n=1 Tax=Streptococcus sp. NLN64 TaxID=2822799 RepID=UPI0018CA7609|nr:hypothetical protein [Streptococcus sp. NLN64]MBG9367900.1 hypothetical protein [Streptococcus sp. NLN64]